MFVWNYYGYDEMYDYVRILCYWKNNGWTYHINGVYGWVTCNGEERLVYNNGYPDFTSSNQGEYLLGYSDYTIKRGHSNKTWNYSARLQSTSSYASGTRYSSTGSYTTGAVTHTVVSYNANGGTGAPGNQDKWYGEQLNLSNSKPSRTGYTFKCWNTNSSGTGTNWNPGANYTPDPGGTVTLYAIWTINTWTVSYNANGGTGAPGNQTKTYGTNLTLSTTKPTKNGYNFKGWATSATGNVSYQAGGTYTANAAITLYAIWELAYIKPRITNLSIYRCNSSGVISENGTYLKFICNWSCDNNVTKVRCEWKKQSISSWSGSDISSSGTSGSVNTILGSNTITTDISWHARIYVTDSGGTTYSTIIDISTIIYPIDVLNKGKGVAFGKVAENQDLADFGWMARFRKGVQIDSPIAGYLHSNGYASDVSSKLSDCKTTGIYSIGGTYSDAPEQKTYYGFMLVIENRCQTWEPTNSGSWLWQYLFTTGGELWFRYGVNSEPMTSWVKKW